MLWQVMLNAVVCVGCCEVHLEGEGAGGLLGR